jgi:hypothetical protein
MKRPLKHLFLATLLFAATVTFVVGCGGETPHTGDGKASPKQAEKEKRGKK